ncbi:tRNA threonylcarbamoyladenosine dehydratase [Megasphaera cerevisiae]|uniref:tRNA threonylcarbamoyladenosine dehydratase n=1 Tax=Megasphaera cerevisiae TaxID=39029 RepID=UPI000943BED5|nr:tRNA threonylcarbamoyladenosine dehydratase [Megasphaera cerevisiae]OKY54189.1 tRNA cyclic N6-threonylcarbamoyladenosine(37) synthase TcdA [Megasphaera cerevisiae]
MKQEYTQRTARLIGQDNVDVLAEKKVLLFGLGGVGSFVAEALCRTGIGHLTLVDADVFDASNLNRQLGATVPSIGRHKTEVMKERLLAINPELHVETHCIFYLPDSQQGFISRSGADYVVDAIDTTSAKIAIIDEAYHAGIPVISSMGAGNKLHPEYFEVAEIEKTSVDPLAKIIRRELKKRNIHHIKVVYSREQPRRAITSGEEKRPSPGSISFVPATAGMILAGVVVRDMLHLD